MEMLACQPNGFFRDSRHNFDQIGLTGLDVAKTILDCR